MFLIFSFFLNDPAPPGIYTLSLHDALPISLMRDIAQAAWECADPGMQYDTTINAWHTCSDRKSTRLNSSHANISYAVFCLKKKKIQAVQALQMFQALGLEVGKQVHFVVFTT